MAAELQRSGIEGGGPTAVPPTCPFFRSVTVDGAVRPPIEAPDGANRCAAYGPPHPQSALQQELVCLTSDHVECPRYQQGQVRLRDAAARRAQVRRLARPTTAAIGFVALAAAASFGLVLARGGLSMPVTAVGDASSLPAAAVVAGEAASPEATPLPSGTRPAVAVVPEPVTTPPTRTSTAPPTPRPTPRPTPPPTPSPTVAARYVGLDPCPGKPGCWVYTVRSGDNLWAIGERFGHSLETVREWNPWTRTRGLRPGAEILLPPPNP